MRLAAPLLLLLCVATAASAQSITSASCRVTVERDTKLWCND